MADPPNVVPDLNWISPLLTPAIARVEPVPLPPTLSITGVTVKIILGISGLVGEVNEANPSIIKWLSGELITTSKYWLALKV